MTSIAAIAAATDPLDRGWARGAGSGPAESGTSPEVLSELLEAVARHSDRSAFAALFNHFAPRIKGFIRRRGVEAAQAEDLAQDVMMTVWKRAALYKRAQGSVSTWIFTIARNRHIDVVRRERRPEIDPDDPLLTGDPIPEGETILSQAQISYRLRNAIQDLPPDQIEVLKKNFFEDKSHSEIALELGLPLGTVKSRVRLAIAKLRHLSEDFA